jgi:hypothetical protein
MTRINFKRTGADHEIHLELDVEQLPAGQGPNLQRMIEAANFFQLSENMGTAGVLDEPQYVVSIEVDGRWHTVNVNDAAVPASLRPLLIELGRLADARQS